MTSLVDLRAKSELRALGDVVGDIRSAAPRADFMLAGAAARDLLLLYQHQIESPRRTTDVDLAFSVPDWAAYEDLRARLDSSGFFTSDERVKHRLRSRVGLPIDLIPFGGVESQSAEIAWPPDGVEVMSVICYAEARAAATEVNLPGDQTLAVVTIPMLALLKLFAWHDRHRVAPRKDAGDLLFLLDNASHAIGLERLLDNAQELMEQDDFDVDLAGAWLVGLDARAVIDRYSQRGPGIIAGATEILERESDPDGPLGLIGEVGATDPERARLRLIAFGNGLLRIGALRIPLTHQRDTKDQRGL